MTGPLDGTLVVGLEHSVAGPLCTRILGDLGAEVIKVERPGGDFSRHWDENAAGEGAQFWWLNRRKRSVVLDLKQPGGRRHFDRLLERADALVHNLSPSAAARLGLPGAGAAGRPARLVSCQISGYGSGGSLRERKAYDMLVQAEAGIMSLTGRPEQPMRSGVSVCDVSTGIYAALLVLAALLERGQTGSGRHLDVAMFDSAAEFVAPMLVSFLNSATVYPRIPDRHHAIAPYGVFPCGDGERVVIAIEQDTEWSTFCAQVLREPELATDPRFASNSARLRHRDQVEDLVGAALAARTGEEAIAELEELGLAYARLNDMQAVASHPVTQERGGTRVVEAASGTPVGSVVGLAERAFGTPSAGRQRPPRLGEDTDAVVAELAAPAGRNARDG